MIIDVSKLFKNYFINRNFEFFDDNSVVSNSNSENESLFVGAGMYKFKDYFLNKKTADRDYCSIQPCIRLDDIDLVGDDTHLTSFLMAGIFSFGFHSQEEILNYVFDFIYSLFGKPNLNKFYITIHPKMKNLFSVWRKLYPGIEIRELEDNIWSAPNIKGYCTEIMFYHNEQEIELGNIVFIKNDKKHFFFDVGLGIDRLSSLINKQPISFNKMYYNQINKILKPEKYNPKFNFENDILVLNDFLHTITLICKDNVIPGPKKQGYVLRNLIRKSLHIMHRMNIDFNFLPEIEQKFFNEEKKKISKIILSAKKYFKKFNYNLEYKYLQETFGFTKDILYTYFDE